MGVNQSRPNPKRKACDLCVPDYCAGSCRKELLVCCCKVPTLDDLSRKPVHIKVMNSVIDGLHSAVRTITCHHLTPEEKEKERLADEQKMERFKKAQEYRMGLLPRFVWDDSVIEVLANSADAKKHPVLERGLTTTDHDGNTVESVKIQKKIKRKLEVGEFDPDAEMYSCMASEADMGAFGIGIGLYFTSVMWLGFMLCVCGGIAMWSTIYYNGNAYLGADGTPGYEERMSASVKAPGLMLVDNRGSAWCPYVEKVCLDADCATTAEKRMCQLTRDVIVPNLAIVFFIMVTLIVLAKRQNAKAEQIDEEQQTAQDYSICVLDPDPEATDPDVWKDFFEKFHFGAHEGCTEKEREKAGKVFMVTVCLNNGELLKLYQKRMKIEHELCLEVEEDVHDYGGVNLDTEFGDPGSGDQALNANIGVFAASPVKANKKSFKKSKSATDALLSAPATEADVELQMPGMSPEMSPSNSDGNLNGSVDVSGGGASPIERQVSNRDSFGFQVNADGSRPGDTAADGTIVKKKSGFKKLMEKLGLDKTQVTFLKARDKVNDKIKKELASADYKATKVFVVFNDEAGQRDCLDKMAVGLLPAAMNHVPKSHIPYLWERKGVVDKNGKTQVNLLNVREAPEPSDIIYENLEVSITRQMVERFITSMVTVGLIIAMFYITAEIDDTSVVALMIAVFNTVLPILTKAMTLGIESHQTHSDLENSFFQKTILARWATSTLIVFFQTEEGSYLSDKHAKQIGKILFADAVTAPIIRVCDFGGMFKRYIKVPMTGTDGRAKVLSEGTAWLLAERYTDISKSLMSAMFFGVIFPIGYFYAALSCFLSYWVDKYCVLRIFKQNPPTGDKLCRVSRSTVAIVLAVHCLSSAHYYWKWPFDGLCPTTTDVSSTGIATGLTSNPLVYEQCPNEFYHLIPYMPNPVNAGWAPMKRWWSGEDQRAIVSVHVILSLGILIYVIAVYFGQDWFLSVYQLFYFHEGDDKGAVYSTTFNQIETGQGYIPQITVDGLSHSLFAVAPGSWGHSLHASPVMSHGADTYVGKPLLARLMTPFFQFEHYLIDWTSDSEAQKQGSHVKSPWTIHAKRHRSVAIRDIINWGLKMKRLGVSGDTVRRKIMGTEMKQIMELQTMGKQVDLAHTDEGRDNLSLRGALGSIGEELEQALSEVEAAETQEYHESNIALDIVRLTLQIMQEDEYDFPYHGRPCVMPFSRQWDLCNPPNPIPPGHHGPLLARAKQYVPKETDENKISQGVNQILGDNSCIGDFTDEVMEDIAKCKHLLCLAVCCHNDRPKHHLKPRPPPRANSENTYGPQSDGGDEVRNALAHNDIEAGVGPGGHVGVGGVIGTQAQVYHTEPEM